MQNINQLVTYKEGEIFNIEIRASKSKSVDPVFIDIINAYTGIKYIDKQAFFMNEWKEIYEFNHYIKSDSKGEAR